MIEIAERLIEAAIMIAHGSRAINVEGRAVRLRDLHEVGLFAVQTAVAIMECVHVSARPQRPAHCSAGASAGWFLGAHSQRHVGILHSCATAGDNRIASRMEARDVFMQK
ncbi:MAG: hypothetical protein H0W42_12005 [Gemmatimonadaceae bacterium]|nr:hypothetical protein [Gemmatimonadaceae bacterium]